MAPPVPSVPATEPFCSGDEVMLALNSLLHLLCAVVASRYRAALQVSASAALTGSDASMGESALCVGEQALSVLRA